MQGPGIEEGTKGDTSIGSIGKIKPLFTRAHPLAAPRLAPVSPLACPSAAPARQRLVRAGGGRAAGAGLGSCDIRFARIGSMLSLYGSKYYDIDRSILA